jgi:hypothetical protein
MPRKASSLDATIGPSKTADHRLKLYSAAALGAGVSMLAMSQPAQGEVVVTRRNIELTSTGGSLTSVTVDLNNDGVADFKFYLSTFEYHSFDAAIDVEALTGGAVVGALGSRGHSYASALMRGAKIGPSAHFATQVFPNIERSHGTANYSGKSTRELYGKWGGNPANRYLGVKFLINGETHYGWLRFSVSSTRHPLSATITAYAYETVANKKILAGVSEAAPSKAKTDSQAHSSASLGMLALGSDGLILWRRD